SVYVPGQFASFDAVQDDPGFSFETVYYHRDATAGRRIAGDGSLGVGVAVIEDYLYLTPGYAFANPVFGGQLYVGVSFAPGGSSTSASATLTGPAGNSISGNRSDAMTSFGDITPFTSLKWNSGPNNFMAYLAANVPVGEYDPNRLAGLGL